MGTGAKTTRKAAENQNSQHRGKQLSFELMHTRTPAIKVTQGAPGVNIGKARY